ncbi:MAG: DUF4350 domain-containing protein [Chitinophagaceae bacterium]
MLKKYFLYGLLTVLILIVQACNNKKETDWSENYDRNNKSPYGSYIAYHSLSEIFPNSKITAGRKVMSEIEKINSDYDFNTHSGNFFIVTAFSFQIDSSEMSSIEQFIENGNGLMIFAKHFSDNILRKFNCQIDTEHNNTSFYSKDTSLKQQFYIYDDQALQLFTFKGRKGNHYFDIDIKNCGNTNVLGFADSLDQANCLYRNEGSGFIALHHSPIVLSNYFLLQENNRAYYEYLFSRFSTTIKRVSWFTYKFKAAGEVEKRNTLWNLLRHVAFKKAFIIIVVLVLLYVLFNIKRKQRIIPIVEYEKNTSLDFVETIGNIYYNQKDNKKLSLKMIQYYLESIRSKYNLSTKTLDEEFAFKLSQKLDQPYQETNTFIIYLDYIRNAHSVHDTDIKYLYTILKKFS